jgi:hypothetical protein
VSKDSEISPGKKNTGWVQYFLFSQFYYLAWVVIIHKMIYSNLHMKKIVSEII